ncbi:MAG TPA: hypothetical protein VJT10_16620 [Steroidobacteraceae bacterium]|nr:hypothetical protein [Steroidobacteraceae bacterium]
MSRSIDDSIALGKASRLQAAKEEGGKSALMVAACWIWSSRIDLRSDCSGFAKAVGELLGITLSGDADAIYSAIAQEGSIWTPLGVGQAAAVRAAGKADMGYFVLAATPGCLSAPSKSDDKQHGHVAVVLGRQLVRQIDEQGKPVGLQFDVFAFDEKKRGWQNEATGRAYTPKGKDGPSGQKLILADSHRPGAAWGQFGGSAAKSGAFGDKLSNSFSSTKAYNPELGTDEKVAEEKSRYGLTRYAYAAVPGVSYG